MTEPNKQKRIILVAVLFCLIFALHLSYLFFVELPDRAQKKQGNGSYNDSCGIKLFDDEADYTTIAYNIVHTGVFGYRKNIPTASRPPLWPFVLSINFLFTNNILYSLILT
jgi:amino acid transporter